MSLTPRIEHTETEPVHGEGEAQGGGGKLLPRPGSIGGVWVVPAWLGGQLDRLAGGAWGGGVGFMVRLFSSIWLGLLWLVLTAFYIALGSGFAGLRAALEMTDSQFFNAWPMVVLMVLLATSLTVVTLRRIPLTIFKLGVWMVHVGILILLVGCFVYFTQKREGSVRIFLNQSAGDYYDSTERALFFERVTPEAGNIPLGSQAMIPLAGLPIYHEYLSADLYPQGFDNPLDMPLSMAGPAVVDPKLAGLKMRVVGYYPSADFGGQMVAGPPQSPPRNPAVAFDLRKLPELGVKEQPDARNTMRLWLKANPVARRQIMLGDGALGIEFLYQPGAKRLAELKSSFKGSLGLTVRVASKKFEQTYAVEPGKPLVIEGAGGWGYTLTPGEISVMPMLSKGYEGTESSLLMVEVARKDPAGGVVKFQRQALFRFPERSPDFVVNAEGKSQRVQDRVDQDLELIFHDARVPQFWIVQEAGDKLSLIQRQPSGLSTQQPLALAKPVVLQMGFPVEFTLLLNTNNVIELPSIIPLRQRPVGGGAMDKLMDSVLVLELTGAGGNTQLAYVPFVQFARMEGPPLGREPALVDVPGVGTLRMVLSTVRRELPSRIQLNNFRVSKLPGATHGINNFISTLRLTDKVTQQAQEVEIWLNHPATDQGLRYFQAAWDGKEQAKPEERFSVIGVGNRPGIWVMVTGSLFMIVGVLYAFYVKPLLLEAWKRRIQTELT